jgi:hypothetical protein
MNAPLKFLFVLGFIGTACSNNAGEEELLKLRKENAELKKKISVFDEAIVLTPENIGKYVSAISFSQSKGKRNEEIQHYTSLALIKVPEHIKVEWESTPEPMSLKEDGIARYSNNIYQSPGKRKFNGSYTLIFPNGREWNIPWEREYVVE